MIRLALAAAAVALAAPQDADHIRQRAIWNRPAAPFTIAGNLHYVGTAGLSSFLLTTPAGHVLIDGGMEESAAQIADNVAALGFRMRDVRYLLINHAHYDHAGGLARLKALAPGAVLVAGAGDRATLETGRSLDRDDLAPFAPVKVDRVVHDGEALRLGGMLLVAQATPGHTQGCTSWTTRLRDTGVAGGRPLAVMFACSLSVAGQRLVGNDRYPGVVSDFRASFARLARTRADVFLTFHPELFEMAGKRARQAAGDRAAFVDPGELGRRVAAARAAFEAELVEQRGR